MRKWKKKMKWNDILMKKENDINEIMKENDENENDNDNNNNNNLI